MGSVIRRRRLRLLRGSSWSRRLLHELTAGPEMPAMSESSDITLQRAITTIGQSDPLIKLMQQVQLGRMKPTDPGLRVVTESWLNTYQKVLETSRLPQAAVRRLDPRPRLAVLIEAGVLTPEHQAVTALLSAFDRVLAESPA